MIRYPTPEIELKKILIHFLNDNPDSTLEIVNQSLFNMKPSDPSFNDLMELKNIINKYYLTNDIGKKAFLHFDFLRFVAEKIFLIQLGWPHCFLGTSTK